MARKSDVHLLFFDQKNQNGSKNPSICKPQKRPISPYLPCCKMLVQLQQRRWTCSKAKHAWLWAMWCLHEQTRNLACQILLLRNLRAAHKLKQKSQQDQNWLCFHQEKSNSFGTSLCHTSTRRSPCVQHDFPDSSTTACHRSLPWSLTPFAWKRCRVWSRTGDLQWKYLHAEDDKRPMHHGCSTKTQSINIYNYICAYYIHL